MTNENSTTWDCLEMLVCPLCHAELTGCAQGLHCIACNLTYTITEGIPCMVNEGWLDESTSQEMAAQDEHFAGLPDKAVFKPDYHSRYRRCRMRQRLEYLLEQLDCGIANTPSVHVACCGTGYEVEALREAGWQASASDLSVQALHGLRKRSAARDYRVPYLQADVRHLPFAAKSFDVAVVVEGLHHTPDPLRGFAELVRIARHQVAVIEPYTTGVLSLLARLGLAHRTEYSRCQPRRLTASLVDQMLSVAGVDGGTARLYLDLPPGLLADTAGDWPILAALLGASNRAAEWLFGIMGVGNRIALIANIN